MGKKSVDVKYVKSYDFKAGLSTGVYGGITSNGLINANFYIDRVIIPNHEIYEIDEDGRIIGNPKSQKDGDLIREVQFGTLLDVATAKEVVKWLNNKIKEHEESFNKNSHD